MAGDTDPFRCALLHRMMKAYEDAAELLYGESHMIAEPMDSAIAAAIAGVFASSGGPGFGAALDQLTRLGAGFDMSCIFGFSPHMPPAVIHDGYSETTDRKALKSYLRGAYLLDPFYAASVSPVREGGMAREGLWRMRDLAPDAYFEGAFAWSQEVHPCISDQAGTLVEEIGFLIPLGSDVTATYSLMRNRGGSAFDEGETARLTALQPVITASLRQHWALMQHPAPAAVPAGPQSEKVFAAAFQSLTPAQQAVTKLILRGHSNLSIAGHIGITEGTVKLHRYNIYRRLGITGQAELFQRFIDFLGR